MRVLYSAGMVVVVVAVLIHLLLIDIELMVEMFFAR